MATSISSLGSTTACVTLHTSSETDTQMMALQQMFELLGSDEMVIAESDKTRAAAQGAYDKLLQNFQGVSEANENLRKRTIQLTGQLSQLNGVHEAETNALREQLGLAEERVQATQLEKGEMARQFQENVAAATRRQFEAVQIAQDAAYAQRETLESSHRTQREALIASQQNEIATLNQSHQRAISVLQEQLSRATHNHQTAVAINTQNEQRVQNLTTKLTQAESQVQSLQAQLNEVNRRISDPGIQALLNM